MKTLKSRFAFALLAAVLAMASVGPLAAAEDCSFAYEGANGPEHWSEICAPKN